MGNKQNKPIVLSMVKEGDPLPPSISLVLLRLANGEVQHVYIDTTITCQLLKELIFKRVTKTLLPKEMVLEKQGRRIGNEECIGSLLTLKDVITQTKIPLAEVSHIQFMSQLQDQISLEQGVAKMPCGHFMGRQSIISLLQCVAKEGRWEIFCPFEGCGQEWDYTFCRKLGTLTTEEDAFFTNKFNENWLVRFSKQCPGCSIAIVKEGGSNKIKCSNQYCKYGYFCFLCFRPWHSKNYIDCGNEQCSFGKNQALLQERKQVLLTGRDGDQMTVSIPCIRLCPGCRMPIEHISGCKHMKCFNCKMEFCFVCLGILRRSWPCGSFNQYCGSVADVQKLHQ